MMQVNGLRFNGLYRITGVDTAQVRQKAGEIDGKSTLALASWEQRVRETTVPEGVLRTPVASMLVATDEDAFVITRDLGITVDPALTKAENEKRFADQLGANAVELKEKYKLAMIRYFLYKETVDKVENIEL